MKERLCKMRSSKSLKKIVIGTVLASGFLFTTPNFAEAKDFIDLYNNGTHNEAVIYLNSLGIYDYKNSQVFNGNAPVTRAEVSKLLHNLYKDQLPPERKYNNNLKDIDYNTHFYNDIIWAYESGIFDGDTKGNFNPYQTLTRAQMAKVLVKTFSLKGNEQASFKDVSLDHWAYTYIGILQNEGISTGDGNGHFMPDDKVTLNQFSSFIYRIMNKYPNILAIGDSTDNHSVSENTLPLDSQVEVRIQEIQQQYNALKPQFVGDMYEIIPSTVPPYSLGKIKDEVLQDALNTTNLMRYIAYLPSVKLNESFNKDAQAASIVNAANNSLSHYPTKPENMSESMFNLGSNGAATSNLSIGYSSIVQSIARGYMEDGDDSNIDRVGHRLWVLSPKLEQVGFGYANGFSAMKVIDSKMYNNASVDYDFISWPAHTAMPTNYFTSEFPWSVSLNNEKYELTSDIQVQLVRLNDNKTWNFDGDQEDGFFVISTNNYGYLPFTIIFRPEEKPDYNPYDRYRVTISNVKKKNGSFTTIEFETTFFALTE